MNIYVLVVALNILVIVWKVLDDKCYCFYLLLYALYSDRYKVFEGVAEDNEKYFLQEIIFIVGYIMYNINFEQFFKNQKIS